MTDSDTRIPAEWEPQSGLLLTWPHDKTDWRENLISIESVFIELVKHVSQHQIVLISCRNEPHRMHIKQQLEKNRVDLQLCHLHIADSNDSWARDHGPVTVFKNGRPLLFDFIFNGWGEKYPADLDNKITMTLYQAGAFGNTTMESRDFIFEGGSFDSDGHDTLMVTSSCLLSPKRNKNLTESEIETKLVELMGMSRIFWIKDCQLKGDDTDGHIDTMARFVNKNTMVYLSTENPEDPNFQTLKSLEEQLKLFTQLNGQPYNLIKLPSLVLKHNNGDYLPASYANFLICNNIVLVPYYQVNGDKLAYDVMKSIFPDRDIIGIDCRALIEQRGSLHCLAMQLPLGVLT